MFVWFGFVVLQLTALGCSWYWLTPQTFSTLSAQLGLGLPLLGTLVDQHKTSHLEAVDAEVDSRPSPCLPSAAFYGRFSSSKQSEESIDIQLDICRRRAEADGFQIPPDLQFSDEGVSGALHSRIGLDGLKEATRSGLVQQLYVRSLSRLSRDMLFNLQDFLWFKSHGVAVVSIEDGIDSRVPNSEITAFITGWKNEQYLKDLAAFVVHGQANSLKQGYAIGDYCYGYRSREIDEEQMSGRRGRKPRKRYVIQEEEAAIVREIFCWYGVEGRSILWIVRNLNARRIPTGHRSRSGQWRYDLVRRILMNPKYIGVWMWGVKQNFRDPETRKTKQKKRPTEEVTELRRDIPELRLVSEEAWDLVHERFSRQADLWKKHRDSTGKLSGSPSGSGKRPSKHMLAGTVFCQHCGSQLYVGGSHGGYFYCPNFRRGTCANQTMVFIDRAEKSLLAELQKRILENAEWTDLIYRQAQAAWERQRSDRPNNLKEMETQLKKVDQQIQNLLDKLEETPESSAISERLRTREQERVRLQREIAIARRQAEVQQPPPSREAVEEALRNLWSVVSARGAEATKPLRRLVGGKIWAEEIRQAGKKRHFIRLHVCLDVSWNPAGASPADLRGNAAVERAELSVASGDHSFTIESRELTDPEKLADEVHRLWSEGRLVKEIAERLGKNRNLIKAAFRVWHESRDLPVPDVRSQPNRAKPPKLAEQLVDQVMPLYKSHLPMQEIAEQVGHDKNIITAAVRIGCEREGIPYVNGRTRRLRIRLGIMEYQPTGTSS